MHTTSLFSFKNQTQKGVYSPILVRKSRIASLASLLDISNVRKADNICSQKAEAKFKSNLSTIKSIKQSPLIVFTNASVLPAVSQWLSCTKVRNFCVSNTLTISKTENKNDLGRGPEEKKTTFFVNVRFVGVGFRGYIIEKEYNEKDQSINNKFLDKAKGISRFLMLKVGQSALTCYPIPTSIQVLCPKDQQADKDAILLIGENLQGLKQVVAEIKSYKKPDPYKGSGIYEAQRIETQEGEIFENEPVFRKIMKKK